VALLLERAGNLAARAGRQHHRLAAGQDWILNGEHHRPHAFGDHRPPACALEAELEKDGIDVLLDDRDERPGVKFNDADLIGCPYHVVIGEKGLKEGQIELKERRTGTVTKLAPTDIASRLKELLGPVLR